MHLHMLKINIFKFFSLLGVSGQNNLKDISPEQIIPKPHCALESLKVLIERTDSQSSPVIIMFGRFGVRSRKLFSEHSR